MNKSEVCKAHESFAYYSGFGGLELKHIEYGIEDYIYCVSGAWTGSHRYHKLKIQYRDNGAYIHLHGYDVNLNDCIRMNEGY